MTTTRTPGFGYRLPRGGLIQRTRTLHFTFDGSKYRGHPGDTLASALIANGVSLVARSFKYHRPRGFYGAGLEEPSALFAVRDAYGYDPAIRAGQVQLVEGLDARSVSGSPSPRFDVGAIAQLASGVLAAGFYYKTFKWPSWSLFEPAVRRASGWGRAQERTDHRWVERRHESCDVLVIGAGPAGLMTAAALMGTGLKVIIADDQPIAGGSLLWESAQLNSGAAESFRDGIMSGLKGEDTFVVLPSTLVAGAYENNIFILVQTVSDQQGVRGQRLWIVRANHVVLATGMIDRPLLFAGNDRPGVMLSSAVRRLIGEYAVAPASRLVVYTNNDSAYLTAVNAKRAGIDVAAIVDTRPAAMAIHRDHVREMDIACHSDTQIAGTFGYRRLSEVMLHNADSGTRRLECDGLAISGGWTPLIHLAAHRGVKAAYDQTKSTFLARQLPANWHVIGGANGALDLKTLADEAVGAARSISCAQGRPANPKWAPDALPVPIESLSFGSVTPLWLPDRGSPAKVWVDLQNDVKVSDIQLAVRENYASVEHLKRYTTLGMGTDQGRTSNVNGLAVLALLTQRDIAAIGTTTFRPPYSAVRMATIANARQGDLYRPRRYLPADAVHRRLGAVMEDYGWERPAWYQLNGVTPDGAVSSEIRAVREHVGVFDGSSLGRIEVTGPDARKFLSRFYATNLADMKPGQIRYSLMLREDGIIFDDGVVTCLGDHHFFASPTSGNAERVLAWFERWRQTEWPELQVAVTAITDGWANIAIAGPEARRLLERLEPDFSIDRAAFEHMTCRAGTVAGISAYISRVSFTGELQFEIAVPARYGAALMEALTAPDAYLEPLPVGMEAWLTLRLEKGYLHVGSEINGRAIPSDVGMAAGVAKRSDDFIGKRSLSLPHAISSDREQLVGIMALGAGLTVGGRILASGHSRVPCPTEGYVTSAEYSEMFRAFVGLAFLERGRQRYGETVAIYCDGNIACCRVMRPMFYDPTNERLRA